MAIPRRRHQFRRHMIPVISAISAALLLLFGFLSFLTPSPTGDDHLRRTMMGDEIGDGNGATPEFHVPGRVLFAGGVHDRDLWSSKNARFYHGCSTATNKFAKAAAVTKPNRYLAIATSGGLNQQRTGITDAVVAARILNATLVIPKLDKKSFWKDDSNFSDIFNVDLFISYLAKDVKIIKELPRRRRVQNPYTMHVPRKCNERCYVSRLLPVLVKKHLAVARKQMIGIILLRAVQLTKFDYRLSNRLDVDLQKLRCRVNYHALKFTDPILEMGAKLVQIMRMRSKHYVALHLRFEPDMLAFSGCYYGGGDKERKELGKIRWRWKSLHISDPEKGRRQGKCPLTPEEVGLVLRALGYDRDTHIYVASGEVYGGEDTLAPLKALFPNFYSKDTIARKKELQPFSRYSPRMAALDFIVCDESDVFVTNNNGNMAKILAGRRRYFGHKLTIRPNAKKLYRLFLSRNNMTWEEFTSKVRSYQRGFMGEPKVRSGSGVFHENPSSCICEDSEAKKIMYPILKHKKDTDVAVEDQNPNDEPEWSDPEDEDEDEDDQMSQLGKSPRNETSSDYDTAPEEPELEEFLSD